VRIRVKPPIEALSNEQILKGEEHVPPVPPRIPAPVEADGPRRPAPRNDARPPARSGPRERGERRERRERGPRGGERGERRERRPPRESQRPLEPLPPAAGEVVQTVQRMLDLSGLAVTAGAAPGPGGMVLHFEGEDSRLLQQRHGELAAAYQTLLNRMARRAWPDIGRIHVEAEGPRADERDDREDRLVAMARSAAEQVARTGRTRRLPPMNAYERRLVHLAVRDFPGLTSISDGEGTLKTVRITKIRNELET
jgi:spoIIIJ-associated protein